MDKCPHCSVAFHDKAKIGFAEEDADGRWRVVHQKCPSCKRLIITLQKFNPNTGFTETSSLARPRTTQRPLAPEVPVEFSADFNEAASILTDSPRASAALTRFCLQKFLREVVKVKKGDLSTEIQEVIDSGKLPSSILESIDAVRNIGNFAAHPNKSKITGEIASVEPHEAEWTLDVLESLFDLYLVQPEIIKRKRAALDKKLKDTGKPPMK